MFTFILLALSACFTAGLVLLLLARNGSLHREIAKLREQLAHALGKNEQLEKGYEGMKDIAAQALEVATVKAPRTSATLSAEEWKQTAQRVREDYFGDSILDADVIE